MHSTEKWLPVPGHETDYMVSDHGRIWSHISGRLLRPTKRAHGGHLAVGLKGRQWRVHQVVMLAFIGPPPAGMEVCHQDGDPENNHLSNLRYDTHAANVNDRRRHGTHTQGVDLGVATRLSEDDVRRIRVLHSEGLTYQKIADMYGIRDRHHIKKIIKRKIWAWVDDDKLTWQSRAHLAPTSDSPKRPSTPTRPHQKTAKTSQTRITMQVRKVGPVGIEPTTEP